jgi:hypothetical protein
VDESADELGLSGTSTVVVVLEEKASIPGEVQLRSENSDVPKAKGSRRWPSRIYFNLVQA